MELPDEWRLTGSHFSVAGYFVVNKIQFDVDSKIATQNIEKFQAL
jgi:hypothetical protein